MHKLGIEADAYGPLHIFALLCMGYVLKTVVDRSRPLGAGHCKRYRATGLPVMVHDMHTTRRRPDYLQACPTGPPVDGVKSVLTPALCGPVLFAVTPGSIQSTADDCRRQY